MTRRISHTTSNGGTGTFVIEIDGKSHYAEYHRDANRWIPDERLYTRNLKIERSLRLQGWEIFRFSDLEVKGRTASTFSCDIARPVSRCGVSRDRHTDLTWRSR
jgi:hypothetical protein